jgi:two-component system chemotaxis sensor kinase CheA
MAELDAELRELFHDETTERLEQMDAALLAIEAGEAGASKIDGLFRNAHTIKGSAGMLGFEEIRAVAHALEDILADARESGVFPPRLAAPLLRATGTMRELLTGSPEPVGALLEELAACRPAPADTRLASADTRSAPADTRAAPADTRSAPADTRAAPAVPRPTLGEPSDPRPEPPPPPAQTAAQAESPGAPQTMPPAGSPEAAQAVTPAAAPAAPAAGAPGPQAGTDRRAVRVPADKIDHLLDVVGEVMQERQRLVHALGGDASLPEELADQLGAGDRMLDELKESAVGLRTLPLRAITGPLPRAVRDLARGVGKQVEFTVAGADTELDRVILESLSEPLTHLLRNSVIHGIESPAERSRAGKPATGRIDLRAIPRGQLVEVVVADDGRGVSKEVIERARHEGSLAELLARPGYSTAGEVTDLAGRGVGLDAVKTHVQSLGGSFEVRSEPGQGTEVALLLPLALAILDVLLFERGGAVFGVPLAAVEEVVQAAQVLTLEGRPALDIRGRPLPVRDVATLLGAEMQPVPLRAQPPGLLLSASGRRGIVTCDELLGEQEVVVKPLSPLLGLSEGYLGAAILGDGRIALLLEPAALIRGIQRVAWSEQEAPARWHAAPKVLVVEDSFTVRELQRSILEAAGYQVVTARDGQEALQSLSREPGIALVVTDFEMPRLDGMELTRAIRADATHSSLPVVIVTSRASEEDRRAGIEAGADAYMAKQGFDQHALLSTVERLVGRLPAGGRGAPGGGDHAARADLRRLTHVRGRAAADAGIRRPRDGFGAMRHRRGGAGGDSAAPPRPGDDGHRTARDGWAHRGRGDHELMPTSDPGPVVPRRAGQRQGSRRAGGRGPRGPRQGRSRPAGSGGGRRGRVPAPRQSAQRGARHPPSARQAGWHGGGGRRQAGGARRAAAAPRLRRRAVCLDRRPTGPVAPAGRPSRRVPDPGAGRAAHRGRVHRRACQLAEPERAPAGRGRQRGGGGGAGGLDRARWSPPHRR